jgi:TRAP-type C4-dicarboxylate transport system permease small subunit
MSGKQQNILLSALSAVVAGLNSLGTVLIFLLVLIINTDVFSRFLFNAPIDGVKEIVELSIVAIVFLQLGDTVRAGKLARSDALYNRILASKPRLGHWMGVFFELAGAVFFAAILIGAMPLFIEAFERGYYVGNKGMFIMQVWPVRLILVIGCMTTVLVFVTRIVAHLKALLEDIKIP